MHTACKYIGIYSIMHIFLAFLCAFFRTPQKINFPMLTISALVSHASSRLSSSWPNHIRHCKPEGHPMMHWIHTVPSLKSKMAPSKKTWILKGPPNRNKRESRHGPPPTHPKKTCVVLRWIYVSWKPEKSEKQQKQLPASSPLMDVREGIHCLIFSQGVTLPFPLKTTSSWGPIIQEGIWKKSSVLSRLQCYSDNFYSKGTRPKEQSWTIILKLRSSNWWLVISEFGLFLYLLRFGKSTLHPLDMMSFPSFGSHLVFFPVGPLEKKPRRLLNVGQWGGRIFSWFSASMWLRVCPK